jgi:hypothetical protein
MKTNLDYLCEELADAVIRWERQAEQTRREGAAYRSRGNVQAETFCMTSAEVCEAHANTLRQLISEYSPEELPESVVR